MKIKTVWHWKNIGKVSAVLLVVAILWAMVPVSPPVGVLGGMVIGSIATMICLDRWDCWHFE